MENQKEGNWMSVPTFGDWDMKNGAVPDYSMDFSKIREMRKQNKKEISRASLGNEEELVKSRSGGDHHRSGGGSSEDVIDHHRRPLHHAGDQSPTGTKKFLSYFHCCIRA
ncbi:hypothetical protein LUZ60_005768 [Juncus effusus]|nr:hypothetical protein LUZ60_005768 [Juncus effusus]